MVTEAEQPDELTVSLPFLAEALPETVERPKLAVSFTRSVNVPTVPEGTVALWNITAKPLLKLENKAPEAVQLPLTSSYTEVSYESMRPYWVQGSLPETLTVKVIVSPRWTVVLEGEMEKRTLPAAAAAKAEQTRR